MTTIRPLEIRLDEKNLSVWVSAGVSIWDLIVYLANYVTPVAPRGYSLLSVPGFVNQTIAGAIATGTHGSSLRHGSFSNQALAFRAILANGTTVEISGESHPFLMKAFRVNVGRLGVVTDVKLRVVPETLTQRILKSAVPMDEILSILKGAQDIYKTTGNLPEELEGAFLFWITANSTFEIYATESLEEPHNLPKSDCSYKECYEPTEESKAFLNDLLQTKINSPVDTSLHSGFVDISDGVDWEEPSPVAPVLSFGSPNITSVQQTATVENLRAYWNNVTVETHEGYMTFEASLTEIVKTIPLDDYSLAVPADKMADCFAEVVSLSEEMALDNGFRSEGFVRFVGQEDALLSSSHSEPTMRFDFNDLVYYNQQNRSTNVPFKELIGFIVTSPLCSPVRLHWGKAGWPDSGCWNGAEIYKDTWCDFGCAVFELDPRGKFVGGDPNIWNWNGANLETCCTSDGYNTSLEGCGCDVIPIRTADECPEAPFFTNR